MGKLETMLCELDGEKLKYKDEALWKDTDKFLEYVEEAVIDLQNSDKDKIWITIEEPEE